jgi:hypothetical protein
MKSMAKQYDVSAWTWLESDGYGKVMVDTVLVLRVPLTTSTSGRKVAQNILKQARMAKKQGLATAGYSS